MWKHEILEALAKQQASSGGRGQKESLLAETCRLAEHGLRKAQAFHFGSTGDFQPLVKEAEKASMREDAIGVRPLPFPFVLYEFDILPSAKGRAGASLAVMAAELDGDGAALLAFLKAPSAGWMLMPCRIWVGGSGGGSWRMVDVANPGSMRLKKDAGGMVCLAATASRVLACVNAGWRTVEPPEKLNRKRVRNGREPCDVYRVVEIAPGALKSKDLGREPWGYRSPEGVRLHLCRGHFKHYTEDRPLFGKWTGTFWWQPTARGKAELGRVDKEYRVRLEEQDADGGGPRP